MPDPILASTIPEDATPTRPLAVVVNDPDGTPAVRLVDLNDQYVTVPTAWTAVAGGVGFQNSWVNYGGGYQSAEYRKVGDVVHVRGMIKDGTINATAFTLPANHRPLAIIYAPAVSNTSFGYATIDSAGNVVPASGSNAWFTFQVMFSVTA